MASILQDLSPTGGTIVNDAATLPTHKKTTRQEERLAYHSTDSLEVLWKEFFRDPSQWWDNRNKKTNPKFPDFKHKLTEEALWVFGWFNPCWVQEELKRRGLQASGKFAKVEYGVFYGGKKTPTASTTKRIHPNTHGEVYLQKATQMAGATSQIDYTILKEMEQIQPNEQSVVVGNNICQPSEEDVRISIILVSSLKACADQRDLQGGSSIHADVVRRGLLKNNLIVGSAVVNMYAKCGALAKAQEVFDMLPVRNIVAWNALIAGYAKHEHGPKALKHFERMQSEGIFPDAVTIVCVLNACGSMGVVDKGQDIHARIVKEGLLDINIVVANALVDMYACCGVLSKAQNVFYELPIWDVVSWTTMITGFTQHGHGKEALNCFEMMQIQGFQPNKATCLCILKACGLEGAVYKGQEMHAALVKDGSLGNDMVVGTALVDMYAKCGALAEAQNVFEELPMQDVVSWGALLDGYAQHTDGEEAFYCFEQMQRRGISPDAVAFICILKASGSIGAACKGQEIHGDISREGLFVKDNVLANSLLDMYAKCGMLAEAQDVFDELHVRDVVSWNALIAGYAQLGEEEIVSCLYNRMIKEGTEPDFVTFTIMLNSCSHRGLLAKGQIYFESMSAGYGIVPTLEHLTCMVDLFGRAGHIDKAVAVIKAMPVCADTSAWHAVLGACQNLGNMKLGVRAFEHASHLDGKHSAAYVCISNIYAAFGKQKDGEEAEAMNGKRKLWKGPGSCWWIDVNGYVHVFCTGDKSHVQIELIYAQLEYIGHKQLGYHTDLHPSLHEIENAKTDVLCGHNVKLAVACALINTPSGTLVPVFKNTLVCSACHSDLALISKIKKRKVFVRDANRFHSFHDGTCTCEEL